MTVGKAVWLDAACNPESFHDHTRAPIRVGPWLCGTDGVVLLAEQRPDAAPEAHPTTAGAVLGWFAEDGLGWTEDSTERLRVLCGRPLLPSECIDCYGSGGVCDACEGDGFLLTTPRPEDHIRAGAHAWDARRIAWILAHVDAPSVAWRVCPTAPGVLLFRWRSGTCRAALMRMADCPNVVKELNSP